MTEQEREELIASLKRHEGFRSLPYLDTVGKMTIGYGHNLHQRPISKRAADVILEDDLAAHMADLNQRLPWVKDLDPVRQAVLYEMAFNLGVSRLLGFKLMLAACRAGKYADAAREMLDSKWASQVGVRAIGLADRMRIGTVAV